MNKQYIGRRHINIPQQYRLCIALNLNALESFESILKDTGLHHLSKSELLNNNPELYLYSYAFRRLRIEQLLDEAEKDNSKAEIVMEHVRELTVENQKVYDCLTGLDISFSDKQIMQLRFFECLQIKQISEATRYTYRWIQRVLQRSLKRLKDSIRVLDD